MHDPTRHALPVLEPSTASNKSGGRTEGPIHSWASDRSRCNSIARLLDDARYRLDSATAACARREPRTDLAGFDDRGRVVAAGRPHAVQEGDILRTFEDLLDVMLQIDRQITEAEDDPPLREFWRGVKFLNREAIDRIVRRITEESTPHSRFDV